MSRVVPALVVSLLVVLGAPASAEETEPAPPPSAEEALKIAEYRGVIMSTLGTQMRASGMILRNEIARPADLVSHATGLHQASQFLAELYPAGTGPEQIPDSRAKPEIWEHWDDFAERAAGFEEASAKLVEVARTGDMAAYGAQFRQVGQSCSACHDDFRVPED